MTLDPVEVNAGAWYLRALRADGRIDDRPALVAAFADPTVALLRLGESSTGAATEYVDRRRREWSTGRACSWAVADPTTGGMVGEVLVRDLDPAAEAGELVCYLLPEARGRGVMAAVLPAVLRFAFGGLALHRVVYRHVAGQAAPARLAERSGFTAEGRERGAALVDGTRHDVLRWARLATDR